MQTNMFVLQFDGRGLTHTPVLCLCKHLFLCFMLIFSMFDRWLLLFLENYLKITLLNLLHFSYWWSTKFVKGRVFSLPFPCFLPLFYSGDRLLLSGFEYALSASSDKRVKVEACAHPPPEWFVYDVNELMYLGCNIGHLPPEIIGLCDSSPQLDFSCVDAYAVGVFISELLEVFEDNHPTVLRFISTAMMAPAPSIRLSLTKARRILECWLWGPQGWFKRGKEQADDIPFARSDVRRWLLHRQTALLSTVALRGMLDQLTVGDLLHCCFLSSARASHIISSGQWLQRLAAIGKI